MGQYLVLLYEDESAYAAAGEGVYEQVLAEHTAFGEAKRRCPARRQRAGTDPRRRRSAPRAGTCCPRQSTARRALNRIRTAAP